jgi:heme oxygenase
MGLRENTAELHSMAEKISFNQRLLNGELSNSEYINYLKSQLYIFEFIEDYFTLPHPSLHRRLSIITDLSNRGVELDEYLDYDSPATKNYTNYLRELGADRILPHIYLNYMALMFGGSIIEKGIKGSTEMYKFKNMDECILSIRQLQSDDWADEVNIGFKYIIDILEELDASR